MPSNSINLNSISIDPFNNNHVFISSFHGGLLEIIDNEAINLLDNTNTPLESIDISDPNYTSVRISDTEFDDSGVLWILNSRVDNPLKSYNSNSGQWKSYDFTDIIPDGLNDELGFSDIEIGQLGNKWIGGLRSGLIGFNENSGSPLIKKIFDIEQANLPSPYVRSLAVDKNNHLWIGTVEGLRVLYNTTNFFDSNVTTQPIVILEDGIPKELLEQQFISDIEVDGANNKWVGTSFLFGKFNNNEELGDIVAHGTTTKNGNKTNYYIVEKFKWDWFNSGDTYGVVVQNQVRDTQI